MFFWNEQNMSFCSWHDIHECVDMFVFVDFCTWDCSFNDLTKNTGRKYNYVNDGGSVDGSMTKAGFVYCSDVLTPFGKLSENDTYPAKRKKTQAFMENATGEKFLFSV